MTNVIIYHYRAIEIISTDILILLYHKNDILRLSVYLV